jgi:hypothetical protein
MRTPILVSPVLVGNSEPKGARTPAVNVQAGGSNPPTFGGGGDGAGGHHPLIEGLIKALPTSGEDWPPEQRRRCAGTRLNATLGRDTVRILSAGPKDAAWKLRAEHRSPKWTTCWNELPHVRAG